MSLIGYFGKVPAHGDFIEKELPRPLTDAMEAWVKAGLASIAARRPQTWLDDYLVSPIWRFAGEVSGRAWAGVLCPSVDAAGRYFPISIAATQDGELAPDDWFKAADALVREALKPDGFDLAAWSEQVRALAAPQAMAAGWRAGADVAPVDGVPFSDPSYDVLLDRAAGAVGAAI